MITLIPEASFARSPSPEGQKIQQLSKPGGTTSAFCLQRDHQPGVDKTANYRYS
jgi:hypothetical protein